MPCSFCHKNVDYQKMYSKLQFACPNDILVVTLSILLVQSNMNELCMLNCVSNESTEAKISRHVYLIIK